MSKLYDQPQIETAYIVAMKVLCTSGEEDSNLGGHGDGKNPWDYGRAPKF